MQCSTIATVGEIQQKLWQNEKMNSGMQTAAKVWQYSSIHTADNQTFYTKDGKADV